MFRRRELVKGFIIVTLGFTLLFIVIHWALSFFNFEMGMGQKIIVFAVISAVVNLLSWFVYFNKRINLLVQQNLQDSMERESAYNQLKATEDQLYHSIEKYQNLISNMRDIFWVSDIHGNILFINTICEAILGYSKETMLGKPMFTFMCPLHVYGKGNCVNIVGEMLTRDFEKEELWMLHVDGHTRKVLEVNTKRVFFDGQVVEVQGVGRDVTERIRLERKIKKNNRQLYILNEISSLLSLDLLKVDHKTLFDRLSKKIVQELAIPLLNIRLINESGTVISVASAGVLKDKLICGDLSFESGLLHTMSHTRSPIVTDGFCKDAFIETQQELLLTERKYKTILIPMHSNDLTIGLITYCVSVDFDLELMPLLNSLTNNVALAVEKLGLYSDIKQFYIKVIKTLIVAMEAKDIYTQGHSVRVAQYAIEIATGLGVNLADFEELEMAGLLHDIGKIGISDAILTKSGKLNQDEYDIIKQHPQIGQRILEPMGFSERILNAVLFHHRCFDLSGYPKDVSLGELTLFTRIIGAADAYDAMTSNRSYKRAMSDEMVIEEFKKYAGTQFCPDVSQVIIQLILQGKLKHPI